MEPFIHIYTGIHTYTQKYIDEKIQSKKQLPKNFKPKTKYKNNTKIRRCWITRLCAG